MDSTRILLVFLLILSGCTGINKDKTIPDSSDNPLESLRLVDLQNKTIDLNNYKDKTVFLNVWATWCKPCIEEMPSIEKLKNILQNENLVFILASSERKEEIETFRQAHNFSFDFVRIENSSDPRIQALPTTFIINSEGKLVFSEAGAREWDEKENIDMLIKILKKK